MIAAALGAAEPIVPAEHVIEEHDYSHQMASVEARLQQLDRSNAEEARVRYVRIRVVAHSHVQNQNQDR